MVKLYWIEITRNIAFSIDGKKRQSFKKWDKVLVWKNDRIAVLRLWGRILWEKELEYDDVFWEIEKKAEAEVIETKPKRGWRKKKAEVEAE